MAEGNEKVKVNANAVQMGAMPQERKGKGIRYVQVRYIWKRMWMVCASP